MADRADQAGRTDRSDQAERAERGRAEEARGFQRTLLVLGAVLVLGLLAQLPADWGAPAAGSRVRDAARLVWPQGWNLFDDGAGAPELAAYRRGPSGWTSALLTPHAQARNSWGLDRGPRAQIGEVAALADLVPPDAWRPCGAPTPDGCRWVPPVLEVASPAARPTLCGELALTVESLDRWGSRPGGGRRIDRAVQLRVGCP
ncbi:hypothetical protein AB0K43_10445 [Kitasatospora sp. NPDC049258]|uniref:hypothetical protein n=1 Tax=Kitasatospora sp. NPDC049258 TaxID=3155394 RepID=UPI0034354176